MKKRRPLSSRAGFTLSEVIIAGFISTIVVGAVASLTLSSLRMYYVDSDYLEVGGQNRRLTDMLIEQGTLADDLAIFRDITDLTTVNRGDRGDCIVLFTRSITSPAGVDPSLWGHITSFECYYLARTPPVGGGSGPISLWHFKGTVTTGQETTDPALAVRNYARTAAKRVSGDIFVGSLPRATPAITTPLTPRAGIFTNDSGGVASAPPTALVNLPARLTPRVSSPTKTTSNVTFAITPRN